jgi:hypothetical protein
MLHACLVDNLAIAADAGWGIWTDKEAMHTYAFLRNNELKFRGVKSNWRKEIQQYETTPGETDGVWQSGDDICWMGDKKQQKGNMMIYSDSLQCCMIAQFLGSKLVLSEVWQKGDDELGICENRVLTKIKKMPAY